MRATRTSAASLLLAALITGIGGWLWLGYARAWDLGGSSPVLSYDAAQYAVAARELADRGRLATIYALPLELSRHPRPPWPLALVQPGLTVFEAALFRLAGPRPFDPHGAPEDRDRLALVLPALSYLAIGLTLAFGARAMVARAAPAAPRWLPFVAGLAIGLAFLLDPEAQHFAAGGFTELPFTLGLAIAVMAIASGWSARRPLLFGLLLGIAGAFRANMLWLAPILALATAAVAPRERRLAVVARILLGYALPLAPWWLYKWRAFGSPGWDLSWVSIWDGVGGRSWFSLNHLPDLPSLPRGGEAVVAIAVKIARNLPALLLELARGPRTLWIGALVIAWLAWRRRAPTAERRASTDPLHAALGATLLALAVSLLAAAVSVPITRYLFPARVIAEAAGMMALGALVASAPEAMLGVHARRFAWIGIAALALTWGGFRTIEGRAQARATAEARGIPAEKALRDLAARLDRELAPGEPVMSNLGPVLAWHARRPVVHLALTPADLEATRRHLDVRVVLLVFRDARRAWPAWQEVLERPGEAADRPEWGVVRAVRFGTPDGFQCVWLDLGPLGTPVASATGAASPAPHVTAGHRASESPSRAARAAAHRATTILRTHSLPPARTLAR